MGKIMDFGQFNEAVQSEVQKEVKKEVKKMPKKALNAYQVFFKNKLKTYGVKNIFQLGDKRQQFFSEIKSEWKKEKKAALKVETPKEETK